MFSLPGFGLFTLPGGNYLNGSGASSVGRTTGLDVASLPELNVEDPLLRETRQLAERLMNEVFKAVMVVMEMNRFDKKDEPVTELRQLVHLINQGSPDQQSLALMAASFMIYYVVESFSVISRGTEMSKVFALRCQAELRIGLETKLKKSFMRNKVLKTGHFTTAELFDKFYWRGDTGMKRAWRRTLERKALYHPMAVKKGGGGENTRGDGTVYIYSRKKEVVQMMVYGNSFKWMEVVNKFGNLWMDHVGLSCNGIPMIHGPTPLPMIVRAGPSSSEGAVQSPEEGAVRSPKAVLGDTFCADSSVASTLTRSTGVSSPQSSVLCSSTPPLQSRNLEALATPSESDMLHGDGSAVITMPPPEPCPNLLLAATLVVQEQEEDPKTSSETIITVQGTPSKSEMVNEDGRSAVAPPEPGPNFMDATLVVPEQEEDPKTSSETITTVQGTIASSPPAKVMVKLKKKAPLKPKAKKVVRKAHDPLGRAGKKVVCKAQQVAKKVLADNEPNSARSSGRGFHGHISKETIMRMKPVILSYKTSYMERLKGYLCDRCGKRDLSAPCQADRNGACLYWLETGNQPRDGAVCSDCYFADDPLPKRVRKRKQPGDK